jgi:hypothetical protein
VPRPTSTTKCPPAERRLGEPSRARVRILVAMMCTFSTLDTVLADGDTVVISPNNVRGEAAQDTTCLDPRCLYSMQGFYRASGVSETRLAVAKRKHGITVPWLVVGKRKFLRGADAIRLIEQLAEISAEVSPKVSPKTVDTLENTK